MTQQERIETDIIGQRFNNLTVVSYSHKKRNTANKFVYYYNCQCDCGNNCVVGRNKLKTKATQSCGCIGREKIIQRNKENTRHDGCSTKHKRLFNIWNGMRYRCYYENTKEYDRYGGRGISICDEWNESFITFKDWALFNGYEEHLTIDRIDVNGNYEPSNCRWATMKEQANNTRRNHLITYKNETKNMSQWCDELGLIYDRVRYRLKSGKMTVEQAFELPKQKGQWKAMEKKSIK